MPQDVPPSHVSPDPGPPATGYASVIGTAPDDPRRGDLINALMDRGRWMEADRLAKEWVAVQPLEPGPLLVRALCAARRFDIREAAEHCAALRRTGAAAAILLGTIAVQLTFGQDAAAVVNVHRALEIIPDDEWDDELQDVCIQAAVGGRDAVLLRRVLDRAGLTPAPLPLGRAVLIGALEVLRGNLLHILVARRDELDP